MGRALDAAEAASGAYGAAMAAALQGAEGAAVPPEQGAMEVDTAPLGQAVAGALRGVVEYEPAAALKAAAGVLLGRLG